MNRISPNIVKMQKKKLTQAAQLVLNRNLRQRITFPVMTNKESSMIFANEALSQ